MSNWISVSERVPDTGTSVFIYSKKGGISEGFYNAVTGKWTQYRWSAKVEATHWMPKDVLGIPEGL